MKVFIEQSGQSQEVHGTKTVQELLDKLALCAEEVIVTQNGTVVLPDASLNDDDDIRILAVVSGG